MKALIIIGVIAFVSSQPIQKRQNAQNVKKNNQISQKAASPNVSANTCQPATNIDIRITKDEKTHWYKEAFAPQTFSNWALVLVGIGATVAALCTLGAIRRQGVSMRRQTTHLRNSVIQGRKAAKATLLGAQAVINGQRAWFLMDKIEDVYLEPIEIQHGRKTTAYFNLKNFGQTVGKMTAWKLGLYITNVDEVPTLGTYDLTGLIFNPAMIPEGAPIPQFAELQTESGIITQQDLDGINRHKTRFLWFCGIVKYEDVFRENFEHTTMFCYRYGVWIPGRGPFFTLAGPDEYNKAT